MTLILGRVKRGKCQLINSRIQSLVLGRPYHTFTNTYNLVSEQFVTHFSYFQPHYAVYHLTLDYPHLNGL